MALYFTGVVTGCSLTKQLTFLIIIFLRST